MKPHLPESKFEDIVMFSKTAVIFPAPVQVLEMLAGIQLSTLRLGVTGLLGTLSPQGSSERGSKLSMATPNQVVPGPFSLSPAAFRKALG